MINPDWCCNKSKRFLKTKLFIEYMQTLIQTEGREPSKCDPFTLKYYDVKKYLCDCEHKNVMNNSYEYTLKEHLELLRQNGHPPWWFEIMTGLNDKYIKFYIIKHYEPKPFNLKGMKYDPESGKWSSFE